MIVIWQITWLSYDNLRQTNTTLKQLRKTIFSAFMENCHYIKQTKFFIFQSTFSLNDWTISLYDLEHSLIQCHKFCIMGGKLYRSCIQYSKRNTSVSLLQIVGIYISVTTLKTKVSVFCSASSCNNHPSYRWWREPMNPFPVRHAHKVKTTNHVCTEGNANESITPILEQNIKQP